MSITLNVNGQRRRVQSSSDTPLLWVLRDELNLTGSKFGCGIAQCGACTVHLDGRAVRSCVLPVSAVASQSVQTIESLDQGPIGRALQQAWLAHQVAQCGYCQSGALMAAAGLLKQTLQPDDAQIAAVLSNLCRCGTYPRMAAAVRAASQALRQSA
jgi:isoquinoline 1-oxidoreductase alpha subunit